MAHSHARRLCGLRQHGRHWQRTLSPGFCPSGQLLHERRDVKVLVARQAGDARVGDGLVGQRGAEQRCQVVTRRMWRWRCRASRRAASQPAAGGERVAGIGSGHLPLRESLALAASTLHGYNAQVATVSCDGCDTGMDICRRALLPLYTCDDTRGNPVCTEFLSRLGRSDASWSGAAVERLSCDR